MRGRVRQDLPHRHPGDGQLAAEVALHQHADRVSTFARHKPARTGADAALPAERDRAGAGADAAFFHLAMRERGQRLLHQRRGQRPGADVAEVAVVGLADHRVDRAHVVHARLSQQPVHGRVGDLPGAQGAGQQDRRLQFAQLLHLGDPGQLAVAVADHDRRRHPLPVQVARMRHDRGDAGMQARAFDQGGVADTDTVHVGDRVARPRCHRADHHPGRARAWTRFVGPGRWQRRGRDQGEHQQETAIDRHQRHLRGIGADDAMRPARRHPPRARAPCAARATGLHRRRSPGPARSRRSPARALR